jgi:hypothetical protein
MTVDVTICKHSHIEITIGSTQRTLAMMLSILILVAYMFSGGCNEKLFSEERI